MQTWRLLKLETNNAFMNMAVDEAILRQRVAESVPNTLRLYRWKPSAVSIGKFQKAENEVYPENCKKLGVDIVRRISGGGTVYHDQEDEVTYSVIAKTADLGTADVAEVYSRIYAAINEALRLMGIAADYNTGDTKNCPNLTVNGKKISGSAQANKSGIVLQHGTLLLKVDLPRMYTLLRVPWANSCMQVVNIAKNKITSVQDELGHSVTAETAANAIAHVFKTALNIQLVEGELTVEELELAEKLHKEKYCTDEWNLGGKSVLG
jgi:lipoate-protein ligase A